MTCYSSKCLQNQYVASVAAGMTIMVCGASFIWITPILPLLNGQDALIPMDSTQISWIVSLPQISSLFSPMLFAVISENWGRKIGILLGGPFIIISWILILTTRDSFSLYIIRLLHGLSIGSLYTTVPIYLGEIAAVNVRGSLTSLAQTIWYAGFLFQYNIGSYLSYQNSALVNLVFSSTVFIFFYLTQPETPFYLIMKNKEDEARESLILLRGVKRPEDVAVELKQIKDNIDANVKNKCKFSDILNLSPVDYKTLMIGQLLVFHKMFSGVVAVPVYINNILQKANWEAISPEVIMTIYGTITLVMSFIGTLSVDYVGRRPLLIFSCVGLTISNLLLAGFFYISDYCKEIGIESIRWLPAFSLVMLTMCFSIGLGPVSQTIQSELFPTHIRALGSTLTVCSSTFAWFLALRFYQILIDHFGIFSNFLLYALNTTIAIFFISKYIPETKGKSFFEISKFFSNNCESDKADIRQETTPIFQYKN